MSFLNLFSSITDYLGALTHSINVDGTPMLNECVDIEGKPFGFVTTYDAPSSSGSGDFGNSFGNGFD
jgi:hypothetical protein